MKHNGTLTSQVTIGLLGRWPDYLYAYTGVVAILIAPHVDVSCLAKGSSITCLSDKHRALNNL